MKVDEKTKELLREYVNKRRQAQGKPALKFEGDQLPCDEDMQKEDEAFRKSLMDAVEDLGPDLLDGNEGTFCLLIKGWLVIMVVFLQAFPSDRKHQNCMEKEG